MGKTENDDEPYLEKILGIVKRGILRSFSLHNVFTKPKKCFQTRSQQVIVVIKKVMFFIKQLTSQKKCCRMGALDRFLKNMTVFLEQVTFSQKQFASWGFYQESVFHVVFFTLGRAGCTPTAGLHIALPFLERFLFSSCSAKNVMRNRDVE